MHSNKSDNLGFQIFNLEKEKPDINPLQRSVREKHLPQIKFVAHNKNDLFETMQRDEDEEEQKEEDSVE